MLDCCHITTILYQLLVFHGNFPRGVYFAIGIDLDLISFRSLKYRPRCNNFFAANLLSHFH